jgi:hypothetical protein
MLYLVYIPHLVLTLVSEIEISSVTGPNRVGFYLRMQREFSLRNVFNKRKKLGDEKCPKG